MTFELPLDSMSTSEKLQAMEALWQDLCTKPADFLSPQWHQEILESRRQRLRDGQATVDDWAAAKKRLEQLGE